MNPTAEDSLKVTSSRVPGKGSILVCEDEEAVGQMVKRILEKGGFSVVHANSGLEALKIINDQAAPFSLILTDVVMPSMSGPELAEEIRLQHPDTKVAFMSGFASDTLSGNDVAEFENFLAKPFTEDGLLDLVSSLVS